MKKVVSLFIVLGIICTMQILSFAHSGRTDSNGGHYNRKTGVYHYHNGGNSSSSKLTKSSSSSISIDNAYSVPYAYTYKPIVPKIVATSVRTFINSFEIPTFEYSGYDRKIVVIAEDLQNYGFDVSWNPTLRTLKISKNSLKEFNAIPMDYYRKLKVGDKLYSINEFSINKVSILTPSNQIGNYTTSYDLNGYMAINVDDLSIYGNFSWNGIDKILDITLKD